MKYRYDTKQGKLVEAEPQILSLAQQEYFKGSKLSDFLTIGEMPLTLDITRL